MDGTLPLAGVPVSVKESFEVTGTPACGGVEALAQTRSQHDAEVVAALRAAGAVPIAKGNLAQLLWFAETDNPVYGRTNNPWALDRSPGGSSGGDAALVAAGVVPLAIGTDIGGSVRIPAHCCGIAALKPTAGRLSLAGTLDERLFADVPWIANQPGIFARDTADVELALRALDREQGAALSTRAGLRVGVFRDNGVLAPSASVRRAVDLAEAAAARAGAIVHPSPRPQPTTRSPCSTPPSAPTAARGSSGCWTAGRPTRASQRRSRTPASTPPTRRAARAWQRGSRSTGGRSRTHSTRRRWTR